MAQPREHLRNAPIEEAIIEFRVQPRPDFQLVKLAPLAQDLSSAYPVVAELREAQFAVGVEGGQEVSSQAQRQHGWLLRSTDNGSAVRLCADNFAFSLLRPYSCWEDLCAKAFALWGRYLAAATPLEVARAGVRYINRLDLARGPWSDYLKAAPALPPPGSQDITQFLTRVVVRDAERGCQATVTQASAIAPAQDRMLLLLDIDAFRLGPWPAGQIRPGEVEPLRSLKNELFFSHLTDAAVALYE